MMKNDAPHGKPSRATRPSRVLRVGESQEHSLAQPIRGSILVVDDDADVRRYLAELVVSLGGTVREAADGAAALQAIAAAPPDLILLDVEMAGMDGLACCRALKGSTLTRLIPVIMVTSLCTMADRLKGIEAGADDFLTKPVHVAELLARMNALLRVKKLNESLESAERVVFTLARAVEAKDAYTEGHTERVTNDAVALGALVGCSEEELTGLHQGGVLHDVGKISVPDHILNKPGKLTPEEFEIIKRHPVTGFNICSSMRSLVHALPCIRWHHEKPNGLGYPDGLKRAAIPRPALILAVADVYDALASKRPYKDALPQEKAFAILREDAGRGALDAELVSQFIEWKRKGGATDAERAAAVKCEHNRV
jgi:putative two-component system response regulator